MRKAMAMMAICALASSVGCSKDKSGKSEKPAKKQGSTVDLRAEAADQEARDNLTKLFTRATRYFERGYGFRRGESK